MNYRPNTKELTLWDTWMFPDPDGERMHLFFLSIRPPDGSLNGIGHAVSADLVHWTDLPYIEVRELIDGYDVGVIGTGMVFPAPGGGFAMVITTNIDGPNQRASFLRSRDLIHWEKTSPRVFIDAQPPYYTTDAAQAVSNPPAFRDPFIVHRDTGYEAIIAGHAAQGPKLLPGCIARYRSLDDTLTRWEPLAPLLGPGVTMLIEVPEYHCIGGRHYLLYSTAYVLGVACDTPARRHCWGTFYAVADSYEGPYTVPEDNLLIGVGSNPGTWHAAIGRIIPWKGEYFLYHQIGRPPLTGTGLIKTVSAEADGHLVTRYWPGIEKLHRNEIRLPLDTNKVQGEIIHVGEWTVRGHDALTGFVDGGGSLALISGDWADFHLRCRVTSDSAIRMGITVRDTGRGGAQPGGVAIQADLRFNEWHFGVPSHAWCTWLAPVETVRESLHPGRTYTLDIFLRDMFFEAYVDGVWKFTRLIDGHARSGGIGFYVENGRARFENIQLWSLEPM